MTNGANPLERRLRLSGILLILGLLTECVCLFWARPISFLVLTGIGGLLLILGIVIYLVAVVSLRHSSKNDNF